MIPIRRICLRLQRQSILTSSLQHPTPILPITAISIRHATTKRKKKVKTGEFKEKDSDRRLRLKRKLEKELDKKRKRYEKAQAARKAQFRLPPHTPREDAIPFGTAMQLLRGWSAKQQIFVQSSAARWAGNTKVVAMVRVVPNDHHPRGIKGKVKFPHPIVSGSKEGKKERIAVILSGEEGVEEAKAAGMIVGDKDYLDKIVKMVSENQALPFDVLLATPQTLSLFRTHGRVLGPKGLMPTDKKGTVVSDLSSYAKKEEKGVELRLDNEGKTSRGAMVRVVVGKFAQDDHDIHENVKALIKHVHKVTGGTQLPLELSLYTTIPPFIAHQNPYLNVQKTIHVPRRSATGGVKLQPPNTVYPPDRPNHLSNASFIVPIADFSGVGHPKHLRPDRFVKRFVADAEWAPALGQELELATYKAGIRELEKKKHVYDWAFNRTKHDKEKERKAGFRRSGDLVESAEESEESNRLVL